MRANFPTDTGHPVSQDLTKPVDAIGGSGKSAAGEHENRASVEPIDLLRQHLGKGCAEDDAFHLREAIDTAQHVPSRGVLRPAYLARYPPSTGSVTPVM